MHGFLALFIHLLVISVQNVSHDKDRKLRRNRVSVFQMFLARDEKNLIAEFSQRFVAVGRDQNGSSLPGFGGF